MDTKLKHYDKMLKYWDEQAEIKKSFRPNPFITNEILNVLKKQKCSNILEIGCGRGYDTITLIRNLQCKITCIDFSPKMIKIAQNHIKKAKLQKNVAFIVDNVLNSNFQKEFFDGVVVRSVLHHLFSQIDIERVCKMVYNSLKMNGVFVLVENWANPNPNKYETLAFQLSKRVRKIRNTKETFLKKDEYIRILKNIGFRKIKYKFLKERISLDRYKLNKELETRVEIINLLFPKGEVKTLLLVGYK
jgi:ubiquinone/menaquinone biosynthesis C-methylase UbiE